MTSKTLKKYRDLLPQQITVTARKTKMGFVAEVKEFPHCYTQGRNFAELIEMINNAIFTYLDIPEKYRGDLGVYLPEKIVNELRRVELQKAFRELVSKPIVSRLVFSRVAPVRV